MVSLFSGQAILRHMYYILRIHAHTNTGQTASENTAISSEVLGLTTFPAEHIRLTHKWSAEAALQTYTEHVFTLDSFA